MISPNRNRERAERLGVRSTLLFDTLNVPAPYLPFRLAASIVNRFCYRLSAATAGARLRNLGFAVSESWRARGQREAVSTATYRRFRSLPAAGAVRLPADQLPPPVTLSKSAGGGKGAA